MVYDVRDTLNTLLILNFLIFYKSSWDPQLSARDPQRVLNPTLGTTVLKGG